ncbi:hypothetical protein [Quisquiliibacterium transsilvanicum]|uniref:Uncharacterized protein n=1 Tax=Quisquiliibacterium transsilvanicum TaxID=1549638 RepID=A0A7W8M8I0_9BURK|nr:hypothetical protein [Quisquiliibacterium transsilvanicum]MBB5271315.1 hypothetical protein [Quisquiliibacterium transsilvanicum]
MSDDPYGSLGELQDPQWSSIWTSWSVERRDQYLEDARHIRIYTYDQVIDILQGHPPRSPGWDHAQTCLSENRAAVERFRYDVKQGRMPPSPTRDELRSWCEACGVDLPDLIRPREEESDYEQAPKARIGALRGQPASVWTVLPQEFQATSETKSARGRPRTTTVRNQDLIEAANKYMFEMARTGVSINLATIIEHLSSLKCGHGMTAEAIRRQITGKLQRARAAVVASRSGAVEPCPRRGNFNRF